ncbi:hypothetical protein HYDPIDRAFT_114878 [Hydnomerulius pinastri MD-312]|uniref:Uncharacterized protein n=1 Tax=Hydnomerulius pinastri MD-312 TaxID=994086 RepID=A0A0C9W668_9AGAM|nr:hypothetical protein HYDPIDRAFT_114878 [Hydnomerulius pinastri MD-312]
MTLGIVDADAIAISEPVAGLYICTDIWGSTIFKFYSFWIPVVIFESILCLLALCVSIRHLLSGYRARGINGVDLSGALVKGNVFYFFCILVACVVNTAMWQNLGFQWIEVPEGFPVTMAVVVGCRLILSLRSALLQDSEAEVGEQVVSSRL